MEPSYLLAASPPEFELLRYVPNDHHGGLQNGFWQPKRSLYAEKPKFIVGGCSEDDSDASLSSSLDDREQLGDTPAGGALRRCQAFNRKCRTFQPKDEEIFAVDDLDEDLKMPGAAAPEMNNSSFTKRILSWIEIYGACRYDDATPGGGGGEASTSRMGKKKVSFADDLGKELHTVRVMTEQSDVPPSLRQDVIDRLRSDGGDENGGVDAPILALNFAQPASDYVSFRTRLERDFVSLENVLIRADGIKGTVKVKNISFEKTVRVRYTFDDWATFVDVDAEYTSKTGGNIAMPFDTFSFRIPVSPADLVDDDDDGRLQFAVCYEAAGRQYWDNNGGQNYEVVSDRKQQQAAAGAAEQMHQNTTDWAVFSIHHNGDSWSEFSGWNVIDKTCPYW